jgi:carbamoyl-phosphate synthase large subunit
MNQNCRVLVTGAGSGVGQGIIKSLNKSDLPLTIVSCDISPMNAALYRTKESILIPRVESNNALSVIIDLILKHKIDMVMIGSEYDLQFFSRNKSKIEELTGARVITAPLKTIEIADDKWLTAEFLRLNNLPYAESFISDSIASVCEKARNWNYPVIVKARRGTSSRNVHLVVDEKQLISSWEMTPNPMLQKLINTPDEELNNEYTSSLFKDAQGNIFGPFHARRTLRSGTSWQIEVERFEIFDELLLSIGNSLDFKGSLNVQFMVGKFGPIPFEINARFSGTTAIRAHFGFNEPEMAVQSFFYGAPIAKPRIKSGIVFRYHEEVFVDGVKLDVLKTHPRFIQGIVEKWF